MKRVDVYFLLLATLLLVCGAILGIVMGAREDFQLVPVHAHLNLAGWASLALFGLTYRAYPELASTKVAGFHFIVSGTARYCSQSASDSPSSAAQPGLAIFASILWLVGVLMFLAQLVRLARRERIAGAAPAE